jgi:hypothetical protein
MSSSPIQGLHECLELSTRLKGCPRFRLRDAFFQDRPPPMRQEGFPVPAHSADASRWFFPAAAEHPRPVRRRDITEVGRFRNPLGNRAS